MVWDLQLIKYPRLPEMSIDYLLILLNNVWSLLPQCSRFPPSQVVFFWKLSIFNSCPSHGFPIFVDISRQNSLSSPS
jgi:hypothetical protein